MTAKTLASALGYQAFFDACSKALLSRHAMPYPVPASHTENMVYSAFQEIQRDMDFRTWKAEVHNLALDLALDDSLFIKVYETVTHGA